MTAFDNDTYLKSQLAEIHRKIGMAPANGSTYIEFGGKSYDDQHAARVLPGYDPDIKLKLLKELSLDFEIILVVSARDILRPRIRGDSQLFYDKETIRVIQALRDQGIAVKYGVVSMIRDDYDASDTAKLEAFFNDSQTQLGITFGRHNFIKGYPDISVLDNPDFFASNTRVNHDKKHVLVLSPGGGSGKFGVCLSELMSDFKDGRNSFFIKFETFPVFNLPPDHPLNRAFMAATADLGNSTFKEAIGNLTTYDKDLQNFFLLRESVLRHSPAPRQNPIFWYGLPSDMGVNKLTDGITDSPAVEHAAQMEIHRRIRRYEDEVQRGIEKQETLDAARGFLWGWTPPVTGDGRDDDSTPDI